MRRLFRRVRLRLHGHGTGACQRLASRLARPVRWDRAAEARSNSCGADVVAGELGDMAGLEQDRRVAGRQLSAPGRCSTSRSPHRFRGSRARQRNTTGTDRRRSSARPRSLSPGRSSDRPAPRRRGRGRAGLRRAARPEARAVSAGRDRTRPCRAGWRRSTVAGRGPQPRGLRSVWRGRLAPPRRPSGGLSFRLSSPPAPADEASGVTTSAGGGVGRQSGGADGRISAPGAARSGLRPSADRFDLVRRGQSVAAALDDVQLDIA